jgi:hypothetical protein
MNPYLEQAAIWQDFHSSYIPKLRAALAPRVGPRYFVRVVEHVYLHELPERAARLLAIADVEVTTNRPGRSAGSVATTSAPATIELAAPPVEEVRVPNLEVIDRRGDRVVTVLELLSPSNKYAGVDRDQYVTKRYELLKAGVNFVEIDLLRGGPRTLPNLPPCDYYALVARVAEWPRAGVWPVRLRDRLPVIPIPLRSGDAEPQLDLQVALHALYDEAVYEPYLYERAPEPALSPEDAAWAAGLIPRAG